MQMRMGEGAGNCLRVCIVCVLCIPIWLGSVGCSFLCSPSVFCRWTHAQVNADFTFVL